jgi:hypothetical protein
VQPGASRAVQEDMPTLSEQQRCALARAYSTSLTLNERRRLAAQYGLTLRQLAQLAR